MLCLVYIIQWEHTKLAEMCGKTFVIPVYTVYMPSAKYLWEIERRLPWSGAFTSHGFVMKCSPGACVELSTNWWSKYQRTL